MAVHQEDVDADVLMPLDTPILKVSRPVAACSRCRNAKIKCDGKLPACTSCEKNGRAAECTATNDQFARGKERSYVSTLETRIEKLQAKLEEARARKPSVVSNPDDETVVGSRRHSEQTLMQDAPGPSSSTPTTRAQRRKEAFAIDDLVSDFGFLSVNATARDFYGFTAVMSYARLVLAACSREPLPKGITKALPPRYAATQLIEHYLKNFFALLPVFDETALYGSIDSVYSNDPSRAVPTDFWIVRMVLAIGSATLSESRGDEHYMEAIGHVCAALERAEDVLHPGSILSVQALVLLTEFAMVDPHHFDSWSLIGAASRAMVDLGLHQDPPKGAAMAKGKLELRRRVFHCIYTLDRSTSLVQTRSFSFSDNAAKVKLPFRKSGSSNPTSPGATDTSKTWIRSYGHAVDLINLRQLQSAWYTDLFQSGRTRWEEPYPYIWSACDSMRRWFENLASDTSPNMRAFFELDLLYSYVYVLSPSPRVPTVAPFAQKLIFEYCIRYAELMLRLVGDPAYTSPVTFYDAMRVYMTGRQFLDVLVHNPDDLLNGLSVPPPEVRPSTSPPPSMPAVNVPPGESPLRFNIMRSITCIQQLTECLSRFGVRWGYMSWNQRYRQETAGMLEDLNARLREFESVASARRASAWHHSSTGSIGSVSMASSNGSISYNSGQNLSPPLNPPNYRQPSISAPSGFNYGDQLLGSSPPQVPQHPGVYGSPSNMPPPQMQNYQAASSQFPNPGQAFNFNDPSSSVPRSGPAVHPGFQFASWGGYGGPSHLDTLDEENAVPPHSMH